MQGFSNYEDILNFEKHPLPQLPNSTYEYMQQGAARNPAQTALTFLRDGNDITNAVQFSYQELMENINQSANMFRALGIGRSDVISIVLPNLPETVFTTFGGETAGIVNPVNNLLEPNQMADIMNAAQTKVLVTVAPTKNNDIWQKVAKIVAQVPTIETILAVNMGDYSGELPQELTIGDTTVLDFNSTKNTYPKATLDFELDIKASDAAAYFHTGGTTGTPKIAVQKHGNEVFDAWVLSYCIPNPKKEALTFFCGLPWFHVNAVLATGIMPFGTGYHVVLGTEGGYRGAGVLPNFWKIIDLYKINFFSCVPTIIQVLLQIPIGNSRVDSLKFAIVGAAPMPVQVMHDFERNTGIKILEGYGLTEGACVSTLNPSLGERRIGSIGLRLPYQKMKTVIYTEGGVFEREGHENEIGNIVIQGPNVFDGYKEAFHNKGLWHEDSEGRWLQTGDMGRMDEAHYFWLTGRKKELIIRGGHNIDPKIIEDALAKHPDVAVVAAVGRPDKRLGEVPVAYIQLKSQAQTTVEALEIFAQTHIGERAAIPKRIYIIPQIPLTAVGKIFKPALSDLQTLDVLKTELDNIQNLGAYQLHIENHKEQGKIARIKVDELMDDTQANIDEAIGAFAVKYLVE